MPDKIEKTTIKGYEWETSYFLSYVSYETYKLIIGNFEVYVKWNSRKIYITTGEYKNLSELINYLKDKEDKTKNINEQTFELFPND